MNPNGMTLTTPRLPVDYEAEVRSNVSTLTRYIPESVGFLKSDNRQILAKLSLLLEKLERIEQRLAALESGE